jgi:hypothetical protein
VSDIKRREGVKGRRPEYLEETLYCIGVLQVHEKLSRITKNDVGHCLELLTSIKNPSIVKANLEWLTSQGFAARLSTKGIDLGYRLTPRGIAHFAVLDCLVTYVFTPAIIKFVIAKVKEMGKTASGEIRLDLRKTWAENSEVRENMLRMLKQRHSNIVDIMPTIMEIIVSTLRFETVKAGGVEKQQRLQNHLEILNSIRNILNDNWVSMNPQADNLMMIYGHITNMCGLMLGIKNVGVEALRNYVDEVIRNNTTVATA